MQEFNIKDISLSQCPSIFILGDNRTLVASIVKNIIMDIELYGILISPVEELNQVYDTIVPNIFTHYKYNNTIIQKFIHRQNMLYNRTDINNRAYVILNDCMSTYSDEFKNLLINHHIYNISPLIVTNHVPILENINEYEYIFIFKNEYSINSFGMCNNVFANYEDFFTIFDCLDDNTCIVIKKDSTIPYIYTVNNLSSRVLKSCEKFNKKFQSIAK